MRDFDGIGALLLVAWFSALLLALACLPGPFAASVPYLLLLLSLAVFAPSAGMACALPGP